MHAVQENGASFEGSMLKLLRTLPKVLKYLPSDKAAVRLPLPPFLSLSLSLTVSLAAPDGHYSMHVRLSRKTT